MSQRDAELLEARLKAQFPDKQVTVLYDRILDQTTVRVDPRGLSPEVYYLAARADENAAICGKP